MQTFPSAVGGGGRGASHVETSSTWRTSKVRSRDGEGGAIGA